MAVPRAAPSVVYGHAAPRIGPAPPARSGVAALRTVAESLGITLMPWQEVAASYLTATGPGGRLRYPEVAIVVARQQGKTTLAKPLIVSRLLDGKRVMHIAQIRDLPRQMFAEIADAFESTGHQHLLPRRRGKILWPRRGSGGEEILLTNGGVYRIAAANRGGARGSSNDLVVIDELREMEDDEVVAAAEPTLTMSPNPQMVYLSNAGHDNSVILNGVKARSGQDPALAYLEWSAAPERKADDIEGWAEANPAMGHYPSVLASLEKSYRAARLTGKMSVFETERLCRWVTTMRQPLLNIAAWNLAEVQRLPAGRKVFLGVAVDPKSWRASAAIAWQIPEGIGLRLVMDIADSSIDSIGLQISDLVKTHRVRAVAYDPMTDAELAKFVRVPKPVSGQTASNASFTFVNLVEANRLRWVECGPVSDDLVWTSRQVQDQRGAYQAVRSNDERPITAALAAIRAVWLAADRPVATPRIY